MVPSGDGFCWRYELYSVLVTDILVFQKFPVVLHAVLGSKPSDPMT